MFPSRAFEHKVVIVTGASSGIGEVTALAFARAGARVIAAARRVDKGQQTAARIREQGGEAIFVQTDVSRAADCEALVAAAARAYGRVDCAFNNAGIGEVDGGLHELDQEQWARILATNLTGVALCRKYELRQMLAQGGGAIVNHASLAGLRGHPDLTIYSAAKHGVVGLTQSSALRYAQQGIRVNAVCPAFIRTPMTLGEAPDPEREAAMSANQPIGRMGVPEEVATAVLWLCSDEASFVTGLAMPIDGGHAAG